jgi:long-chain acyl-CoA synthetase
MLARLCNEAGPGTIFPALQAVVYGASPINPETRRAAANLFGPVLHHVYGLSETTGAFTELAPGPANDSGRDRSVGVPYPWVEMDIRNPESGSPVRQGEVGEVRTRSAQNTIGYFRRPQDTAALLTEDGWLRTGDAGYVDSDGYLFLTDRIKDMIISGGENVYPAEVEAVLRQHPGVAEVAVVGVPDETWGETVGAVVVPRQGVSLDGQALIDFARPRLAGYKRPRRIRIVDELPLNASGKVLKRDLRAGFGLAETSERGGG